MTPTKPKLWDDTWFSGVLMVILAMVLVFVVGMLGGCARFQHPNARWVDGVHEDGVHEGDPRSETDFVGDRARCADISGKVKGDEMLRSKVFMLCMMESNWILMEIPVVP